MKVITVTFIQLFILMFLQAIYYIIVQLYTWSSSWLSLIVTAQVITLVITLVAGLVGLYYPVSHKSSSFYFPCCNNIFKRIKKKHSCTWKMPKIILGGMYVTLLLIESISFKWSKLSLTSATDTNTKIGEQILL